MSTPNKIERLLAIIAAVSASILGLLFFLFGIFARESDAILPASTRRGPMTPDHALIAGIIFLIFGIGLLVSIFSSKKNR